MYVVFFLPGTLHEHEYGAVESVHIRDVPTENCTLFTPTLSEAEAFIVVVLPLVTVLPFAGEVIATVGGVVSELTIGVGVAVGNGNGVLVG